MNVVLISTYELGRQPFGLASPAAWLGNAGAEVTCLDVSREPFREDAIRAADLVAFCVPMHTATRLAVQLVGTIRELNPNAHICFYGLYAPVNEAYLRKLGVGTILGGEFEQGLVDLAARLAAETNGKQREPVISLARQKFLLPDRGGMIPLEKYVRLIMPTGETRTVGYTEASRGCKHLCRHCPTVPVYNGAFRIVDRDVVLEDIRQQVEAGAQHITFGDPDFFNGPTHALTIVEALHREFPRLTYDVTIKIEHLLQQARNLMALRDAGCLFVTSAVESVDDAVLERIRENDLVESVAPIQLAIRLLIPAGSRLLELPEVPEMIGPFDEEALLYPWSHVDPRVDQLCEEIQRQVHADEKLKCSRAPIFENIWETAHHAPGLSVVAERAQPLLVVRAAIPYLNEPWYC